MPVRYRSADEDSARWTDFPFRDGDIVISTRSKSGTTWLQTICALLILRTDGLPAPLAELSPWLDWTGAPLPSVLDALAAQPHRRFVKTHTPLDGLPLDDRAFYLVAARHPLDMAVSLYHQGANLDRRRIASLTGAPPDPGPRPPVAEWLRGWIDRDAAPADALDSLPGVLHHLSDAWSRRHAANVVLVHYDDLQSDLEGQMRRLASILGLPRPTEELVAGATFERMRARADEFAPNQAGILRSPAAFFRRGSSGAGRELLDAGALAHYRERAARFAPADLLAWLHRW